MKKKKVSVHIFSVMTHEQVPKNDSESTRYHSRHVAPLRHIVLIPSQPDTTRHVAPLRHTVLIQSTRYHSRHVAPLRHIVLIPSQPDTTPDMLLHSDTLSWSRVNQIPLQTCRSTPTHCPDPKSTRHHSRHVAPLRHIVLIPSQPDTTPDMSLHSDTLS